MSDFTPDFHSGFSNKRGFRNQNERTASVTWLNIGVREVKLSGEMRDTEAQVKGQKLVH